jgi:hypothetical protein
MDNSPSEEADDYRAIVVRLNQRWRVIACSAGIQWILQRAVGERHGRTRWASQSFCRTREALIRLSHASEPRAAAILSELPERYVEVTALGSGGDLSATVVAPPIEPALPCSEEADNYGPPIGQASRLI